MLVILLLLAAGGGGWWYYYGPGNTEQANANDLSATADGAGKGSGNNVSKPPTGGGGGDGGQDDPPVVGPPTPSAAQKAEAQRFYKTGMAQLSSNTNKPFEARRYLSLAVLSGHLSPADDRSAVLALTELANKYVLSPRIDPLDEYSARYSVTSNDSKGLDYLTRHKLKLQVPWQCVMMISDSGLTDMIHQGKPVDLALLEKKAGRLNIGQTLKTINGAFHAVISKSRHIMDIYLHRPGGDKIFVRRVPVATGKHGCTPSGKWVVSARMYHPPYTPAANSPLRKTGIMKGRGSILYGQEHYAFGSKGLWIALRGTSDNTLARTSYGIHSTSHQESIGSDASEGCVRVGDNDIELVYCLLYPTGKTATTPASTVDIRE